MSRFSRAKSLHTAIKSQETAVFRLSCDELSKRAFECACNSFVINVHAMAWRLQ
jgi:hypothetical protein